MFIPKELITYILGFITFPMVCYLVYIIKYKGKDDEDGHNH